eukprot:129457-Chlamydomonas_euryale.AAC.1
MQRTPWLSGRITKRPDKPCVASSASSCGSCGHTVMGAPGARCAPPRRDHQAIGQGMRCQQRQVAHEPRAGQRAGMGQGMDRRARDDVCKGQGMDGRVRDKA